MRNAQCLNAKNHPPVAGFLAMIGNLRLIVGDGGIGHWLDPILCSANWEHQQLMLQSFVLAQSLVSGGVGW